MTRRAVASVSALFALLAAALVGAGAAGADPQDLVPVCSGDQTPMNSGCQWAADQPMATFPGANPDLPLGPNPGVQLAS